MIGSDDWTLLFLLFKFKEHWKYFLIRSNYLMLHCSSGKIIKKLFGLLLLITARCNSFFQNYQSLLFRQDAHVVTVHCNSLETWLPSLESGYKLKKTGLEFFSLVIHVISFIRLKNSKTITSNVHIHTIS